MKSSLRKDFPLIPRKLGKKHITISFAVCRDVSAFQKAIQKFKSEVCNKSNMFFMTESVKISFLLQPPKEAISKARLPCSIDLGSITGTHLTTYHRKHTRVTHCPHHQELEKLHSQQLFTRIVSSKISCRDFHCIFRIHCRTTWELTLQEV